MKRTGLIGLVALIALGSCGRSQEPKARFSSSNALCGVRGIEGRVIAPIDGPGACGIADPVQITSVSGIALSTPVRVDCPTAIAFKNWVDHGIKPAARWRGRVKTIQIAASYACRPRNSQSGAKLSEHALGHAIDVSGIELRNGKVLTVKDDWRRGRVMKKMHASACGTFGTVLGPKSDRFHQDHIHVDTARYRSGPYCR
ncbi:Extensin-like protein C-terminus [Thioclava dalianensis]|uniref:extensin-like domain-containing protein n=1 Tax=Thioclava dalianensis TaxID=1185766 RepID=UPI0008F66A37|nr:extensin family protein [Thioclava dalianensis]SFN43439.1 Extensin-like protein C-terminus [Thioclava dalianensis]